MPEAVGGLAGRMGAPIPIIGLIRRGEVNFQVDDPEYTAVR